MYYIYFNCVKKKQYYYINPKRQYDFYQQLRLKNLENGQLQYFSSYKILTYIIVFLWKVEAADQSNNILFNPYKANEIFLYSRKVVHAYITHKYYLSFGIVHWQNIKLNLIFI